MFVNREFVIQKLSIFERSKMKGSRFVLYGEYTLPNDFVVKRNYKISKETLKPPATEVEIKFLQQKYL